MHSYAFARHLINGAIHKLGIQTNCQIPKDLSHSQFGGYDFNENWSDRKTWISEEFVFFQKKINNCEKLNTRFHAKFLSAILKNPYYTPMQYGSGYYTPWEIWLVAFRIYHICKIKDILSKYMIMKVIIILISMLYNTNVYSVTAIKSNILVSRRLTNRDEEIYCYWWYYTIIAWWWGRSMDGPNQHAKIALFIFSIPNEKSALIKRQNKNQNKLFWEQIKQHE